MAKKQAIVNESEAGAAPARIEKPKTPRVRAAQHSKAISTESAIGQTDSENASEAIAQIAYGIWESRGCQGGTDVEDWVRAEHEYRQRQAATRL